MEVSNFMYNSMDTPIICESAHNYSLCSQNVHQNNISDHKCTLNIISSIKIFQNHIYHTAYLTLWWSQNVLNITNTGHDIIQHINSKIPQQKWENASSPSLENIVEHCRKVYGNVSKKYGTTTRLTTKNVENPSN